MKLKAKFVFLIIGILCGAISYWFNSYNEMYVGKINIYYLMIFLSFSATVVLGFFFREKRYKIPIYFCLGFILSVLGRIFFDISNDSTTHNFFPFEIVFTLVIILPCSFLGSYIINFINSRRQ